MICVKIDLKVPLSGRIYAPRKGIVISVYGKKETAFENDNMDTNSSVCNCGYSDIFDWRLFSNSNQT